MTIHHDKMAYGKLQSLNEDISPDRLQAMLKQLKDDEEEQQLKAKTASQPSSKKDEK